MSLRRWWTTNVFTSRAGSQVIGGGGEEDLNAAILRLRSRLGPSLVGELPHLAHEALSCALEYCQQLVVRLPGPVTLNRGAFASDARVHALFASAEGMGEMLGRSPAVREFLLRSPAWEFDHFYALLAARRHEKSGFGLAQQGDIIVSEVAQTRLHFSDQVLIEPHVALEDTLKGLFWRAFDSLIASFLTHVEALRVERRQTHDESAMERVHRVALYSRTCARPRSRNGTPFLNEGDVSGGEPEGEGLQVPTRRLEGLEQRLRDIDQALQPRHLIAALGDFLREPQGALSMNPFYRWLDRQGVVLTGENLEDEEQQRAKAQGYECLEFQELTSRDQRRHVVVLARLSIEDARQAWVAGEDARARHLII